jgi:tetratricopeptide (TPR) repeat protein
MLALVLWAAPAISAEPSPEPSMEQAHRAYSEGETAYRLGHFEEAATRYEEAYRASRFPNILFDIGQACRRWYEIDKNVDHLRKARDMFKAYLHDSPTGKQRAVAERHLPELERLIADDARRRREELIARANGRDGLFLAEQLLAEKAVPEATIVVDRILQTRDNPRDVLVGALEKRAEIAGATNDLDGAKTGFQKLLALDPGFQLPEGIEATTRSAFEEARLFWRDKRPLALSQVPPGEALPGRPVRIAVHVESDPLEMVDQFAVFYRRAGGGAYSSVHAARDASALEIPSEFLRALSAGARIEYYLAALDASGSHLLDLGGPTDPYVCSVAGSPQPPPRAEMPKPWYRRSWIWWVAGSVVVTAGAGVGIWAGTRPAPHNPPVVTVPTP